MNRREEIDERNHEEIRQLIVSGDPIPKQEPDQKTGEMLYTDEEWLRECAMERHVKKIKDEELVPGFTTVPHAVFTPPDSPYAIANEGVERFHCEHNKSRCDNYAFYRATIKSKKGDSMLYLCKRHGSDLACKMPDAVALRPIEKVTNEQ